MFYILLGIALVVSPFIIMENKSFISVLRDFVAKQEKFSAVPVWDYKQWSIGYGTAVGYDKSKKPKVIWTEEQGFAAMQKVFDEHYLQLGNYVSVPLNANQWAALLSFSYNLGVGNAVKLMHNINARNKQALIDQWNKYVVAGGVRLNGLVKRRAAEVKLFYS